MDTNAILDYMRKKVEATGLLEDYTGELHPGKLARVPLENTICAGGGSTFAYLRRGTGKNLIIAFNGGGASWNAETAKYPMTHEATITGKMALDAVTADTAGEFALFALSKKLGILSPDNKNLFSDWNVLVINYVTGDFHVGDNDFPYTASDGTAKLLHHRGHHNFLEAMKTCKSFFPSADKLLITGGSAGAFAVPALTPEVMDFYPDCKDVTVYSDSAFVLMDEYKDIAKNVWKTNRELAEAIHSNDISADWYERLYRLKGDSIRYLYSNSYRDFMLVSFQNYHDTGVYEAPKELCKEYTPHLKQHVDRLRQVCPKMGFSINDFKSFIPKAKGTTHCTLTYDLFFKNHKGSVSDMQWLHDAVHGKIYDMDTGLLEA